MRYIEMITWGPVAPPLQNQSYRISDIGYLTGKSEWVVVRSDNVTQRYGHRRLDRIGERDPAHAWPRAVVSSRAPLTLGFHAFNHESGMVALNMTHRDIINMQAK
jgi:hypothetical protein